MKDFKKYLQDGRRVAAFGKQIGQEVELFLLYCSKKDHFSKEWVNLVYRLFQIKVVEYNGKSFKWGVTNLHPVILRIPISEGDSAEYTFKKYMRDNFYKCHTYTEYCKREVTTLRKGEESARIFKRSKVRELKINEYVNL
jgi:hypothetical protein